MRILQGIGLGGEWGGRGFFNGFMNMPRLTERGFYRQLAAVRRSVGLVSETFCFHDLVNMYPGDSLYSTWALENAFPSFKLFAGYRRSIHPDEIAESPQS